MFLSSSIERKLELKSKTRNDKVKVTQKAMEKAMACTHIGTRNELNGLKRELKSHNMKMTRLTWEYHRVLCISITSETTGKIIK